MNNLKITLIDLNKLTFKINNTLFLDLKNNYLNHYNNIYKLNKYERFVLIRELNLNVILNDYLIKEFGGLNEDL